MTKPDFIKWAQERGWTLDRWGHLHKADHRFKLSRISVRLEAKCESGWVHIRSAYFSKLWVSGAGKLAGLRLDL